MLQASSNLVYIHTAVIVHLLHLLHISDDSVSLRPLTMRMTMNYDRCTIVRPYQGTAVCCIAVATSVGVYVERTRSKEHAKEIPLKMKSHKF
jgi:hypothetical protein